MVSNEERLERLFARDDSNEKRSLLTYFKATDYLYLWTNELLKEIYNECLNGEKVLIVRSSGDHAIHVALAGAKEVHLFDVNDLSYFNSSLKISMIRSLDYNVFYEMMNYLSRDNLNPITDKIGSLLTSYELNFWELYEKLSKKYNRSLFITADSYTPRNNAYFDEDTFYKTKEKLKECKIKHHNLAAEDLSKELSGECFDVIYLSNIIGRIERPVSSVRNVATNLLNNLETLLCENGVIYDYALKVGMHDCYRDAEVDKTFDTTNKVLLPNGDVVYSYKKKTTL